MDRNPLANNGNVSHRLSPHLMWNTLLSHLFIKKSTRWTTPISLHPPWPTFHTQFLRHLLSCCCCCRRHPPLPSRSTAATAAPTIDIHHHWLTCPLLIAITGLIVVFAIVGNPISCCHHCHQHQHCRLLMSPQRPMSALAATKMRGGRLAG